MHRGQARFRERQRRLGVGHGHALMDHAMPPAVQRDFDAMAVGAAVLIGRPPGSAEENTATAAFLVPVAC